jgi:hypothetical protein
MDLSEELENLSKKYSYGCLFMRNRLLIFINNDKAFYGCNFNSETKPTEFEGEDLKNVRDILHLRIDSIYRENKRVIISGVKSRNLHKCDEKQQNPTKRSLPCNESINSRNSRGKKKQKQQSSSARSSGGGFTDFTISNNYTDIFELPSEEEDMSTFYIDHLSNVKNGELNPNAYNTSTEEKNDVKAIILCFFHITDFKAKGETSGFIESMPGDVQDGTVNGFKKSLIENKRLRLPPIYMDVTYKYSSSGSKEILERQYYLSDGNNRIATLKELNYDGLVPVIVCDYLPYTIRTKNTRP